MTRYRRLSALLLLALLPLQSIGTGAPAFAEAPASKPVERPWLYQNSDVPMDPAWLFGVLPNGLRYGIRRNRVPPGQVSIRVRMDVGSLMERPDEGGYAHFIEHLSFRGSREVADGEAKRIWQRLGATFGSDSNAQTSPTGTSYALDLPSATDASLSESFKILAGMMAAPNIVPAAVEAERSVIMAERREGLSPQMRVGDAVRALYFAGQPLARGNPIGTPETLGKASAASLKAFHDRWYRPERAVIAVSGDADPALVEQLIKRYFGPWAVKGPPTPDPDFGRPDPKASASKVIVEPNSPVSVGLAWLRPWRPHADTIRYNQDKLIGLLALQLINRRLEEAARGGAKFVTANVDQQDVSRSVVASFASITPLGGDWRGALHDVRAIIADAVTTPPSQADIDREYASAEAGYAITAQNSDTEASAVQADTLIAAVDIRETTVSPQVALDIFRSIKAQITPARMFAATKAMFSGTRRGVLTLQQPVSGADQALASALAAPVAPAKDVRLAGALINMDSLPKLPAPGEVVNRTPIGALKVEQVTFANGVKLLLFANAAEQEKVRIQVRFGRGEQSFAPGVDGALWAAPYVLTANGVANLDQRAVDQITNGRRIGFNFEVADNAFIWSAVSREEDYRDQLKLFALKIAQPRWDARPVERIKAVLTAAESASTASPNAVLNRYLNWLLRDRDDRFAPVEAERVKALTAERFRDIWEPRLAEGPIEVNIFGDVKAEEAIAAVAATFGALPPRAVQPVPDANRKLSFPAHVTRPAVLRHDGPPEQAAAVMAWPTGAGYPSLREGRQLEILSQIMNDRLFERFRSVEGAAYSPNVVNSWPETYVTGGYIAAMAQVRPERLALFGRFVRDIAADLAAAPVTADELTRVLAPMRQSLGRASTGNAFWLDQMQGAGFDPGVLPALGSFGSDLLSVTATDIQALARKYLVDDRSWSAIVLARGAAVPSDIAAGWPEAARTAEARAAAH